MLRWVATHEVVDRTRATKTHDAVVCRKYRLQVLFPKEIKAYGELRKELVSRFISVSR